MCIIHIFCTADNRWFFPYCTLAIVLILSFLMTLAFVKLASCVEKRFFSRIVTHCPKPTYDTGCTHCEIPQFPPDQQIDFNKNLHQTASQPWKHVLVLLHGVTDFNNMPSKINLVPGSFANELEVLKRSKLSSVHPVLVSNIITQEWNGKSENGMFKVMIFPEAKVVQFNPNHLSEFIEHYLLPDKAPVTDLHNPFANFGNGKKLESIKYPKLFQEEPVEKDMVLICGHTQRDIRCGILGPMLAEEFSQVLKRENLTSKVDVGLISHIGGHAYAGNVIYFPHNTKQFPVTWYGRVFPPNVQGIVKETIVGKRVISELFRGDLRQFE